MFVSEVCVSLKGKVGRSGSIEVFSSCVVESDLSMVDWSSCRSSLLVSSIPRPSGPGDSERGQ